MEGLREEVGHKGAPHLIIMNKCPNIYPVSLMGVPVSLVCYLVMCKWQNCPFQMKLERLQKKYDDLQQTQHADKPDHDRLDTELNFSHLFTLQKLGFIEMKFLRSLSLSLSLCIHHPNFSLILSMEDSQEKMDLIKVCEYLIKL